MYGLEREKAGIAWKIILFIEMSSYRMEMAILPIMNIRRCEVHPGH